MPLAFWRVSVKTFADVHPERTLSVTAATGRGVAGLLKDAERGENIIVERHGRAVAAVISAQSVEHFDELHRVRADVNSPQPSSRRASSPMSATVLT